VASNEIPLPHVAIYGGAFIDIKWQALGPIYDGSSSAGTKSEHFGGVARNIAESLAWLGAPCSLISRLGNDSEGLRVLSHLKQLSVNIDHMDISPELPTANYCGLFTSTKELFTALTDIRLYQEIDARWLDRAIIGNQHARVHVIDTDLPQQAIEAIAQKASSEVWVSVTCVEAVTKIMPILARVHGLFLNLSELLALVREDSVDDAAAAMLNQGVKFVVVTQGREGALLATKTTRLHCPAPSASVVDVTGAGDALAAGFLFAYLHEQPLASCLQFGIQAASLTLKTLASVSPKLRDLASLLRR